MPTIKAAQRAALEVASAEVLRALDVAKGEFEEDGEAPSLSALMPQAVEWRMTFETIQKLYVCAVTVTDAVLYSNDAGPIVGSLAEGLILALVLRKAEALLRGEGAVLRDLARGPVLRFDVGSEQLFQV